MYGTQDKALDLLDRAASTREHADRVLRSAIREALASNVSVELVATRAGTTIDNVLAIVDGAYDSPYADRA
jgi:hypothetical protein